jgi:hypothetical protein
MDRKPWEKDEQGKGEMEKANLEGEIMENGEMGKGRIRAKAKWVKIQRKGKYPGRS